LPSARAALISVSSCTETLLGSNTRSSCDRLVAIFFAMSSFVSFAACMPSSFRKSSNLEPVRGLRFATLPLLEAFLRQLDIGIRCLLCLLDESMEQHHLSALDREQCPPDTIDQRCSNLPDGSP